MATRKLVRVKTEVQVFDKLVDVGCDVISSRSTYSGKVFQVTLLSLGGFLLLPLLVIILILESPIQPEVLR